MLIKNLLIHDAIHPEPYRGDIRTEKGKLLTVGGELIPLPDEEVLDGEGLWAYPGFVDAHSHIGLDDYGGSTGGNCDYNEMNDTLSPQMRGIDSYYPQDSYIPRALAAGVTTVGTGPGSANVLGGTFLAVKLWGSSVDKAVIRPAVAMKCAFGENPKRCYGSKSNSTRMSTAAKLRDALYLAKDYLTRKEAAGGDIGKMPKYDSKMEALIPVVQKKMPLKAHAHRADDILTAVRIARELDVRLTLEHVTEGHLIVDELVEAGLPVAVGPTMTSSSKPELWNKSFTTPGVLSEAGLQVSIITDAPVILEEYLPLCAGLAIKAGMNPFKALQAITINPARHLGVDDRVGSLEAGKDADIVLADGDPTVSDTKVIHVILDGVIRV